MPGETGLRHLTAAAGTRRQRRSERPKGARGRLLALMVAPSYTIRAALGPTGARHAACACGRSS